MKHGIINEGYYGERKWFLKYWLKIILNSNIRKIWNYYTK